MTIQPQPLHVYFSVCLINNNFISNAHSRKEGTKLQRGTSKIFQKYYTNEVSMYSECIQLSNDKSSQMKSQDSWFSSNSYRHKKQPLKRQVFNRSRISSTHSNRLKSKLPFPPNFTQSRNPSFKKLAQLTDHGTKTSNHQESTETAPNWAQKPRTKPKQETKQRYETNRRKLA